jgi:hypothetical protein
MINQLINTFAEMPLWLLVINVLAVFFVVFWFVSGVIKKHRIKKQSQIDVIETAHAKMVKEHD